MKGTCRPGGRDCFSFSAFSLSVIFRVYKNLEHRTWVTEMSNLNSWLVMQSIPWTWHCQHSSWSSRSWRPSSLPSGGSPWSPWSHGASSESSAISKSRSRRNRPGRHWTKLRYKIFLLLNICSLHQDRTLLDHDVVNRPVIVVHLYLTQSLDIQHSLQNVDVSERQFRRQLYLVDSPKNGMLPIQPLCGRQGNEKLWPICVGTAKNHSCKLEN